MPERDAQQCDEQTCTFLHIQVNMVLNVHRNRTAYKGWGGGRGYGGGCEGDDIPIATLSPPE